MQEKLIHDDDRFHISADAVNSDERVSVLNHFDTFAIFDQCGNVQPRGKMVQGIYHKGTRYISQLMLYINGKKLLLLGSAIREENDIHTVDLTNSYIGDCNLSDNTIHIARNQFLRNGAYYEEVRCVHYGESSCSFTLSLFFDGDFKDIFEIRGLERKIIPDAVEATLVNAGTSELQYMGLDSITRTARISIDTETSFHLRPRRVDFDVVLQPNQPLLIQYGIEFWMGPEEHTSVSYTAAKADLEADIARNNEMLANVKTSNAQFNHWINRSKIDLISLLAQTDRGKYPYAGVPWYNTPFGRDGLITAMETLWLAPSISRDVLLFLASRQATTLIAEKDAEPGKILHETRFGEMANTGEVPFKQYYGTIDATPLFVMLAGMYHKRTCDTPFIQQIWPNIKAAINWINVYGDIDGDGFVEYQHKAENGLANQGWKDSFDSIMHEDGTLADSPIALCEVQAYVYSAKSYAAQLALVVNEPGLSKQWAKEADVLKKQFNERFWDVQLGCYVLALDGNKKPCRVVTSNAGHCLFTRIADVDKAKLLAETLLSENMFSGWGVRTLTAKARRYNPMSYHNGSVWPHDNALIAYGLSLYGFRDQLLKIMKAVFDASLHMEMQRLPELYCGFNQRAGVGPTLYPVACSPQAWSVAAVFMLLQACLCVDINALTKTIVFNKPVLPKYLAQVDIAHLELDEGICNLNIKRHAYDVGFNLLQRPTSWEILIRK